MMPIKFNFKLAFFLTY